MGEVTKAEAVKINRLIDLCWDLTSDAPSEPLDEIIAKIKSLMHGNHMNARGLYRGGINLRP